MGGTGMGPEQVLLPCELIRKGFKQNGIFLALDGTEDDRFTLHDVIESDLVHAAPSQVHSS